MDLVAAADPFAKTRLFSRQPLVRARRQRGARGGGGTPAAVALCMNEPRLSVAVVAALLMTTPLACSVSAPTDADAKPADEVNAEPVTKNPELWAPLHRTLSKPNTTSYRVYDSDAAAVADA